MPTLSTAGGERVALRRLQTLAENLPALDLEQEVDQAARLLRAELPTLPDYELLSADNQAFYDIATGLRAAASLLSTAILGANDGLAKLKTPEYEYTWAVPPLSEREAWAREIAEATGHLVRYARTLEPAPPCRPRFSMFGAAGVARARTRQQRIYSLQGITRLYVPSGWVNDSWFSLIGPDDGFIDDKLPRD